MTALRPVGYMLSVLFWLLTATYGLLASQAFIQEQFLKPGLVPPLAWFAHNAHFVLVAVAAAWVPPRWQAVRRGQPPGIAAAVVWAASIVAAFAGPGLSDLEPGALPLAMAAWACAAAVVLAWAEYAGIPHAAWSPPAARSAADFTACLVAFTASNAIETAAARMTAADPLSLLDWSVSLRVNLLLGAVAFLAITLVRGVASLRATVQAWEARLTVAVLVLAFAGFIAFAVLASISWRGEGAAVAALLGGSAVVAVLVARPLARRSSPTDGVVSALGGFVPRRVATPVGLTAWALVLLAVAYVTQRASQSGDWNFIVARLGVVAVWLGMLAGSIRVIRFAGGPSLAVWFGVSAGLLAGHATIDRFTVAGAPRLHSTRWFAEMLAPPARGLDDLFDLLPRHTNIAETVGPADFAWATLSGPPARARPHIFVIVVDSLRRDYLSPYNEAVGFTPAFGAFARDSLVFDRAFTQYGATGLSVPSLWVGGPILHKQYVTPFAPMNMLARLLDHEQYAQWVGMDSILEVILPSSPRRLALDANIPLRDFRLCRTLAEVSDRLSTFGAGGDPIFMYSVPADIHVSTLTREGGRPVDAEAYPGFYTPVASRVHRMDGCFGAFVSALKAKGIYDESVIVVTADHGDSLGEEGRMGHAYTIYPEVMRVPLIVHLPVSMRAKWSVDVARVAFTTDLTPTLYRLLGHDPQPPQPFFGEPLVFLPGRTPPVPRDRMVASSYGSVYGAVMNGGRRLYIVDAMQLREMLYVMDPGPSPGRAAVPDAETRTRGAAVIRDTVEALARMHGYRPK